MWGVSVCAGLCDWVCAHVKHRLRRRGIQDLQANVVNSELVSVTERSATAE